MVSVASTEVRRPEPAYEDQSAVWRVDGLAGIDLFKASFKRFTYGRHMHASYALGLIETGAQTFHHGGIRHLAPAGTIIAVNPGETHDGEAARPEGYGYRMLYVDPGRFLPEEERADLVALRGPAIQDPRLARSLALLLLRLDGEEARAGAGVSLELQSRLLLLWKHLCSRHGGVPARPAGRDDAPVRRARDYLAANAPDNLQLAEVAKVAGLSPFHFLRRFTAAYGLTPHAWLMAMRLEAARGRRADRAGSRRGRLRRPGPPHPPVQGGVRADARTVRNRPGRHPVQEARGKQRLTGRGERDSRGHSLVLAEQCGSSPIWRALHLR